MKSKGVLYLIPTILTLESDINSIPWQVVERINVVDLLLSENPKTSRAFLKRIKIDRPIQEFQIDRFDKHSTESEAMKYIKFMEKGQSLGILSESGCPAVADPGNILVRMCHKNSIKVVPLVGPSSILLALMASGLNGQNFAFGGYIPANKENRVSYIKKLNNEVIKSKQTRIFIETPYRNQLLFDAFIKYLANEVYLCVAIDLSTNTEIIKTMKIRDWKNDKDKFMLKNRQVTFLVGV